jgi:hypothetical protein
MFNVIEIQPHAIQPKTAPLKHGKVLSDVLSRREKNGTRLWKREPMAYPVRMARRHARVEEYASEKVHAASCLSTAQQRQA